jgi:flagellar biosynthesis protein FlhB
MLFELIFLTLIGVIFVIVGWLIWKKQKINLIHSYHYDKVAEADKKHYTAIMGKGTIIIGLGIFVTGIIDFITQTGLGWIAFGVGFVTGLGFMIYAGLKYNR